MMITQERLKEMLDYDPETGVFTWIAKPCSRICIGAIAGCNSHGYMVIGLDGVLHMAHRLAWLYMRGGFTKDQIDHINHIRNDNRWVNLREVTHLENKRNLPQRSNNTSGVIGVSWNKLERKWQATIKVNYRNKSLGYFKDKFEATCARKSAQNRYGFHPNHGAVRNDELR